MSDRDKEEEDDIWGGLATSGRSGRTRSSKLYESRRHSDIDRSRQGAELRPTFAMAQMHYARRALGHE